MKKDFVSVIIPCYNQGRLLGEALAGIESSNSDCFEVIIVNDGSTDKFTNEYIAQLAKKGWHVVEQNNSGLGAARNTAIGVAQGEFILPLDSDNKITCKYIQEGIEILSKNPKVAVVYSDATYFGDRTGLLRPGPFNLQRLMLGNYIDACAVIRRSVLEELGGYEDMKIMGYEDWDLWLRIAFAGYKFHYIPEPLFSYRYSSQSMMRTLNADIARQNAIEKYFAEKFADKLDFEFVHDRMLYKLKKSPFEIVFKALLKKISPAKYERLIRENKLARGYLYKK